MMFSDHWKQILSASPSIYLSSNKKANTKQRRKKERRKKRKEAWNAQTPSQAYLNMNCFSCCALGIQIKQTSSPITCAQTIFSSHIIHMTYMIRFGPCYNVINTARHSQTGLYHYMMLNGVVLLPFEKNNCIYGWNATARFVSRFCIMYLYLYACVSAITQTANSNGSALGIKILERTKLPWKWI